jgi:hypothetical protein
VDVHFDSVRMEGSTYQRDIPILPLFVNSRTRNLRDIQLLVSRTHSPTEGISSSLISDVLEFPQFQAYTSSASVSGIHKFSSPFQAYTISLNFRCTQVSSISGLLKFPKFQTYSRSLSFRPTQVSSISGLLNFSQFQSYASFLNFRPTQVPSVSELLKFPQFQAYTSFLNFMPT